MIGRSPPAVAEQIDGSCAVSQDLTSEVAYAADLALDEFLINTISYGYADDEPHRGEIILSLEAGALVIMDDSATLDLSNAPTPGIGASLEERPLGGLDFFLVHQMADSIAYRREEERNLVTPKKEQDPRDRPRGRLTVPVSPSSASLPHSGRLLHRKILDAWVGFRRTPICDCIRLEPYRHALAERCRRHHHPIATERLEWKAAR